jgi:hypothetical protein
MHAGTISSAQARSLAVFVNTLRPDWDVPGIAAALHKARNRAPVDELAHALVRFASRTDLRTPAVFAEDGTHWMGLVVAEARAPQRPKCPTHGIAVRVTDGLCTGCVADTKAADENRADTLAIDPDQLDVNQRGVRVVKQAIANAQRGDRP